MPCIHQVMLTITSLRCLSCCRITDQDFYLENLRIKSGSFIYVSLYALHMSGLLWDKPEVFNPNRWFSHGHHRDSRAYDTTLTTEIDDRMRTFLPFSNGPRSCIAQVSPYSIQICQVQSQAISTILYIFAYEYTLLSLLTIKSFLFEADDGHDGASDGHSKLLFLFPPPPNG